MTSNAGSEAVQELFKETKGKINRVVKEQMEREALSALNRMMRPEFLNRIDEIVLFEPLDKNDVRNILKLQLHGIAERLEGAGIELLISQDALDWMTEVGYSLNFGARPMKRLIQKEILNRLSKELLAGKLTKGKRKVLDVFDQQVVFRDELEKDCCISIAGIHETQYNL